MTPFHQDTLAGVNSQQSSSLSESCSLLLTSLMLQTAPEEAEEWTPAPWWPMAGSTGRGGWAPRTRPPMVTPHCESQLLIIQTPSVICNSTIPLLSNLFPRCHNVNLQLKVSSLYIQLILELISVADTTMALSEAEVILK